MLFFGVNSSANSSLYIYIYIFILLKLNYANIMSRIDYLLLQIQTKKSKVVYFISLKEHPECATMIAQLFNLSECQTLYNKHNVLFRMSVHCLSSVLLVVVMLVVTQLYYYLC